MLRLVRQPFIGNFVYRSQCDENRLFTTQHTHTHTHTREQETGFHNSRLYFTIITIWLKNGINRSTLTGILITKAGYRYLTKMCVFTTDSLSHADYNHLTEPDESVVRRVQRIFGNQDPMATDTLTTPCRAPSTAYRTYRCSCELTHRYGLVPVKVNLLLP